MADDREFHFLIDAAGALIVFQETGAAWASVLAFSSEKLAREFLERSNLEVSEIGALDESDVGAIANLIRAVKPRAVRNILLDLDYATGECVAIEFEGDELGIERAHRLTPGAQVRRS